MLLSKSSPLRPGGRQPYNGAFGVGAAGPLPLPVPLEAYCVGGHTFGYQLVRGAYIPND